MAFSGNVASITLDEVFAFLADNALEGKLIIRAGEAALTLYFKEGFVFFPASGRRGTYSLNAILRHTGVISPEALAGYLQDLKASLAAQQDEESEELTAARRMQYTEEIHDLFLWGDAAFEFEPCRWPQQAVAEHRLGRGLVLETQPLLLEAARRTDERLRIRRWIPSGRLILRCTSAEALGRVRAALAAHNLELEGEGEAEADPFADGRNLDDLLTEWRVPHHLILASLARLVEAGDLEPMPEDQTRAGFEELLAEDYLGGAARFLAHWVDLGPLGEGVEPLELVFARSGAFRFGPLTAVTLRLPGTRSFALLRALMEGATPFTLILRRRGREKRIVGGPDEVCVSRRGPWTRSATPPLREFLRKLGHLTPQEMDALPDDEAAVAAVPPEAFSEAMVAKLIDELAEVAFWEPSEVELHNVAVRDKAPETELSVGLGVNDREQLERGLAGWSEILDRVPGEDCIFVMSQVRNPDGSPRFFTRFDLSRGGGEQASTLEFARFVARGLDLGWLRQASKKELLGGVEQARTDRNDVLALRLALAGHAQGYGAAFSELVAGYRRADVALPSRLPSLEGDLKGVGLAAVLQALHNQHRTGTLTVSAGRRRQDLFFSRGDAFLLRLDEGEADEFVSFFLDSDDPDAVAPRFRPSSAEGLIEAEAEALEAEFLDALLWEEATFAFTQNALPDAFFSDEEARVALKTRSFLLRAMERLREWDRVTTVVGDGKTVLQFCDDDAKLEAIQAGRLTEALTLIDGRLTFDDLVRISQQPKLDVGTAVAGLVEEGRLTILHRIPDATPAPKRT